MNILLMRKSKQLISYEDVDFLFQELYKTWNLQNVPSHHRETFSNNLKFLPPSSVAFTIAKEIDDLESGLNPIQMVLDSISKREFLIGKLLTFDGKARNLNRDFEITELETAYFIQKLRKITADVLKNIEKWKNMFLGIECEFYWNQICYVEKVKHDLDFLRKLGRFKFMMRDPFFLNTDSEKVCLKAKTIVKASPKDKKIFKKLEKMLNYGLPEIGNFKVSKAEKFDQQFQKVFDAKILTKEESEALRETNEILSCIIFSLTDDLLETISFDVLLELKIYDSLLDHLVESEASSILKENENLSKEI
jgi:hypothetical protein